MISFVHLIFANYSFAWKIFVDRDQNERIIAPSYIHAVIPRD